MVRSSIHTQTLGLAGTSLQQGRPTPACSPTRCSFRNCLLPTCHRPHVSTPLRGLLSELTVWSVLHFRNLDPTQKDWHSQTAQTSLPTSLPSLEAGRCCAVHFSARALPNLPPSLSPGWPGTWLGCFQKHAGKTSTPAPRCARGQRRLQGVMLLGKPHHIVEMKCLLLGHPVHQAKRRSV